LATRNVQNNPPLLTIGRASKMLGVSEATLRQWTDEGKIRAFVTPGGHRRYAEAEVRNFSGTQRRIHGVKDLVARMQMTPHLELEIAHTHFTATSWYSNLDKESLDRLREFGRRMHHLAITAITKQNKYEDTLQLAREIGSELGAYLSLIGLSLPESVEAFILHRSPLLSATADLIKKRTAVHERAADAIPLLIQTTDEALLSMVKAYQEYQAGNVPYLEGNT